MIQRRLILLLLLGIGSVLLLIFGVLILMGRLNSSATQPIDAPGQPSIERSIQELTGSPIITDLPLQVISILPDGPEQNYLPITHIEFTFNAVVHKEELRYTIDPLTDVNVFVEDTTVIFAPTGTWPPGKITITIESGTQSAAGQILESPETYSFISDYDMGGVEGEEYE